MKKYIKTALVCLSVLLMVCMTSCGIQPYSEVTQDMSKAPDPQIVGFWLDPVQTSKGYDDVWEYRADGKLYLHQIDKDGVIYKSIDGSYAINGAKLSVKIMDYTLNYDSYEVISDSLVLSDHGVESAFAKYTKTVYK